MNKRNKREVYKHLTKKLGSPLTFSDAKREIVLTILGGWLRQGRPNGRGRWGNNYSLPERVSYDRKKEPNTFEKAAAKVKFPAPRWHWKILFLVMAPKTKGFCPSHVAYPLYADPQQGWGWKRKDPGKNLVIALPVNYNITVPRDISVVGKKVIQRAWNHRVYSDKETWECSYWDFSKLTNDENSHTKATWHEGFLVKMATGAAAETTLSRAITLATGRTVRAGIKSILSDANEA